MRKVPKKKPRSERIADDAYLTPVPHALAICRWIDTLIETPKRIIEPSAGGGAFVAAARHVWPAARIVAVDVRPECEDACKRAGADEFYLQSWEDFCDYVGGRGVDLILGNPPFLLAERHVRFAMRELLPEAHLSFLLRSSFWSGQRRSRDFWPKHTPYAWAPIANRPSFTEDGGTDGAEYGVWVWRAGWQGAPRVGKHIWSVDAERSARLRVVGEDEFGEADGE